MGWIDKLKRLFFSRMKGKKMGFPHFGKSDCSHIKHVFVMHGQDGTCQGIAMTQDGHCYFGTCQEAEALALNMGMPCVEIPQQLIWAFLTGYSAGSASQIVQKPKSESLPDHRQSSMIATS